MSLMGPHSPHIHSMDGERVNVVVPTEGRDGIVSYCWIEFGRCSNHHAWVLEISDDLIRAAPEAIHAALGLALMELKAVTP